jgi:hypothetical protein
MRRWIIWTAYDERMHTPPTQCLKLCTGHDFGFTMNMDQAQFLGMQNFVHLTVIGSFQLNGYGSFERKGFEIRHSHEIISMLKNKGAEWGNHMYTSHTSKWVSKWWINEILPSWISGGWKKDLSFICHCHSWLCTCSIHNTQRILFPIQTSQLQSTKIQSYDQWNQPQWGGGVLDTMASCIRSPGKKHSLTFVVVFRYRLFRSNAPHKMR